MREFTEATKTQRIHSEERLVGKRATFHIFHTSPTGKNGRYDISYEATPEAAIKNMEDDCRQMRMKIVVVGFARCDQSVAL